MEAYTQESVIVALGTRAARRVLAECVLHWPSRSSCCCICALFCENLHTAVSAWNVSNNEWEGPLTWCIAALAKLTSPPSLWQWYWGSVCYVAALLMVGKPEQSRVSGCLGVSLLGQTCTAQGVSESWDSLVLGNAWRVWRSKPTLWIKLWNKLIMSDNGVKLTYDPTYSPLAAAFWNVWMKCRNVWIVFRGRLHPDCYNDNNEWLQPCLTLVCSWRWLGRPKDRGYGFNMIVTSEEGEGTLITQWGSGEGGQLFWLSTHSQRVLWNGSTSTWSAPMPSPLLPQTFL